MSDDEALSKFRSFCGHAAGKPEYDDFNWFDLSIGFFAALDLPYLQCSRLASSARYEFKYWVGIGQGGKSS